MCARVVLVIRVTVAMPRSPWTTESKKGKIQKITMCRYYLPEMKQWCWRGNLISRRRVTCRVLLTEDKVKKDLIWLEELETTKSYRGQGYAKRLLQITLQAFGNNEQFSQMRLRLQPFGKYPRLDDNQLAMFYSKMGFSQLSSCQPIWGINLTRTE